MGNLNRKTFLTAPTAEELLPSLVEQQKARKLMDWIEQSAKPYRQPGIPYEPR